MEVLEKKKYTCQEFREFEFAENDVFYYELIEGEIVRKQSPTFDHQRLVKVLFRKLDDHANKTKSGETFFAPLDVILDDGNCYIPDLLFIKSDRLFILDEKERIVIGAPDLIIEILSKSTAANDKGKKKDNYEKHGVQEYWLVDHKKKSVEVYALKAGRYQLIDYAEDSGTIASALLEGFVVDVEQLFNQAKIM